MAAHFGDHPLGRSVLGTAETVGALTPEQMRAYFERQYSPGNIALVASGNVDFDQLVKDAERVCGTWKQFDVARETPRAASNAKLEVIQKEGNYTGTRIKVVASLGKISQQVQIDINLELKRFAKIILLVRKLRILILLLNS